MDQTKKIKFIPFHAINEFMRNDFRLIVIRTTLLSYNQLDRKYALPIDQLTKRYVKVAGFRNSAKAPATVKAVAMVKAFETQPKLVAAILQAWSETQPGLRQKVYDLLLRRGWKLLPIEFNRTKLPGFLTRWPAEDDYDTIYNSLLQDYPDLEVSIDQTSLMVVWLSGRLPIDKVEKDTLEAPELSVASED